jgi:succinate-semialdehyde dehydrogenase/glutarate-semialdehyde dehydrogenase
MFRKQFQRGEIKMLMYINGSWSQSKNGSIAEVTNPATKEVIGTIPQATKDDVEAAINAANAAKKGWARTPVWKRAEILQRFAGLVEKNKEELVQILSKESGKVLYQSEWEVDTVIRLFHSYPEHAKTLYGQNIPLDSQQGVENDVYLTRREPLGVLVGIVPFNFPLDAFSHKVGPALSSGNVMIIKPPNDTPLAILRVTELLYEAGLPENVLQVITGPGKQVGEWLSASNQIDGISLTGSTETGIKVASNAIKSLKPAFLELGGNDPLIVFDDADIELAAEQAVFGRTIMNGQVCCTTKRMIIHRSKVKDFTDLLIENLKKIKHGNQLEQGVVMGPLIHERAVMTVNDQVQLTVKQGAKVVFGGEVVDKAWYLPTVLSNVSKDTDIARDMEIFGPVFPVISFDTDEEAIEIANNSIYGLNGAIFTRDVNRAVNVGYQIESGIVVVNGTSVYRPDVSYFGGYKMSGMGREGLLGAMHEMTQIKSVALRNSLKIYDQQ